MDLQRRVKNAFDPSGFLLPAASWGRLTVSELRVIPGCAGLRRLFALHPLWIVPESLPDLSAVASGSGLSARANSADDQRGTGRSAGKRQFRRAHRQMPGLPGLRDRVSLRNRIRQDGGICARADRATTGDHSFHAWRETLPIVDFFHIRGESQFSRDCCAYISAADCRRPLASPDCCRRWGWRNVKHFCLGSMTNFSFAGWEKRFMPSENVGLAWRFLPVA